MERCIHYRSSSHAPGHRVASSAVGLSFGSLANMDATRSANPGGCRGHSFRFTNALRLSLCVGAAPGNAAGSSPYCL